MLYRHILCIHPQGRSMGLVGSIVDKLLSSWTTCTISWLGSNRSALHCVLFLPTSQQRRITLWGPVSRCLYERNVNEVTAVLLLSTGWCRGQVSPRTAWEMTFTFRSSDMYVRTHTHAQILLLQTGVRKALWAFSAAPTQDPTCKTHKRIWNTHLPVKVTCT